MPGALVATLRIDSSTQVVWRPVERNQAQVGDGPALQAEHLQAPTIGLDRLTLLGKASETSKDEPSDGRVRAFRQGDAQIGQVMDREGARQQD